MGTLAIVALVLLGYYLASCYSYPFSTCPWCGSKPRRTNKKGAWRIKKRWLLHRWLHPGDPYIRLGARLRRRG